MHAIEKILAKAAGKDKVETGVIVNCKIDFAETPYILSMKWEEEGLG